ncbi:hypothetical protein CHISP_2681 [Chitinispirillum alkaliphilum]|nr:hypothetical protein CHISP_2681 [Chitinispirillum alkaliphilum]
MEKKRKCGGCGGGFDFSRLAFLGDFACGESIPLLYRGEIGYTLNPPAPRHSTLMLSERNTDVFANYSQVWAVTLINSGPTPEGRRAKSTNKWFKNYSLLYT